MRAVLTVFVLVGSAVLSGCLGNTPATTLDSGAKYAELPRLTLNGQSVLGDAPLLWKGNELGEGDAENWTLDLHVPPGYWDGHTGFLDVAIRYDERDMAGFELLVEQVEGPGEWEGEGWIDMVAIAPTPESGQYRVTVTSTYGMASYQAVAQLESRPKEGAVRDLLPNLVTLNPTDLNFYTPRTCVSAVVTYECVPVSPPGVRGCSLFEFVEEGNKKCLRFSNRIGNVGEGPFEIELAQEQIPASYVGKGTWHQTVYRSDGSKRVEKVGEAAYHATHGHFHYQGMAHYRLFKYDLATQTRGEAVSEGRKVGFCFLDMGLVALGLPHTTPPKYGNDDAGCGLNPNWYDLYWYTLDEQFIDVTDLPDGTYELVSTANILGTAIESDKTDNAASVVFRMTGYQIKVLRDEPPAA